LVPFELRPVDVALVVILQHDFPLKDCGLLPVGAPRLHKVLIQHVKERA
jgi:hypothetical protein